MKYLYTLKFAHRFALLLGTVALSFCFYAGWSYKVLEELKVNGPLYNNIALGKDLIADILPPPEYIIESYLVVLKLSTMTDAKQQNEAIETLTRLKQDYDSRRDYWLQQAKDGFDTASLEQSSTMALSFYDLVFKSLIPAIQKSDQDTIHLVMPKIEASYQAHRLQIDSVVKAATEHLKANEALAAQRLADVSGRFPTFGPGYRLRGRSKCPQTAGH
jgi:predicted glycosyltransferase